MQWTGFCLTVSVLHFLQPAEVLAEESLPPVGYNLNQYPSIVAWAAAIRTGSLKSQSATLEDLNIQLDDGKLVVNGTEYEVNEHGIAEIEGRMYQVRGDAVDVNGVWYRPSTLPPDQLRRKPALRPLPPAQPGKTPALDQQTMLIITLPAAFAMMLVFVLFLCCTRQNRWCFGMCDKQLVKMDMLLLQHETMLRQI